MCTDIEMEPILQDVTEGVLPRGTNKAPDARMDIRAQGFLAREQSALFDVTVCHPNADSHKIYNLHENDEKASLLVQSS